jgi:hypothetical protein
MHDSALSAACVRGESRRAAVPCLPRLETGGVPAARRCRLRAFAALPSRHPAARQASGAGPLRSAGGTDAAAAARVHQQAAAGWVPALPCQRRQEFVQRRLSLSRWPRAVLAARCVTPSCPPTTTPHPTHTHRPSCPSRPRPPTRRPSPRSVSGAGGRAVLRRAAPWLPTSTPACVADPARACQARSRPTLSQRCVALHRMSLPHSLTLSPQSNSGHPGMPMVCGPAPPWRAVYARTDTAKLTLFSSFSRAWPRLPTCSSPGKCLLPQRQDLRRSGGAGVRARGRSI